MRDKFIYALNAALKDEFDFVPLYKTIKIADALLSNKDIFPQNFAEKDSDRFVLSEDTDFGTDLIMFISDWREDLGFSADDVTKVRENMCFGVIAMDVQEYLMENDCSLDDIDMGRYTADERVMDLVHVVTKAYQDYLNGNYTDSTVTKFIESFSQENSVSGLVDVLEDAVDRAGVAGSGEKGSDYIRE